MMLDADSREPQYLQEAAKTAKVVSIIIPLHASIIKLTEIPGTNFWPRD